MWEDAAGRKIKKKVLLIDDEKDFTRMVKINLEGEGDFEVRVENSGAQGLAAARTFKPDLVILDILMPEMEGSEVAAQLRSDELTRDIPIVFLTAVATKEEVKTNEGVIGGHPFIAKPVEIKELVGVIREYIR